MINAIVSTVVKAPATTTPTAADPRCTSKEEV